MRALLVVAFVFAIHASSQPHPNFSGTWRLNVAKSDLQEPNLRGAVFSISHRDPAFVIERNLIYGSERKTAKFNLTTDGKHAIVPYGDEKLDLTLRWNDGGLICSIKQQDDADPEADRVKYSMSPDGKLLTVTELGRHTRRTWVLERQQ